MSYKCCFCGLEAEVPEGVHPMIALDHQHFDWTVMGHGHPIDAVVCSRHSQTEAWQKIKHIDFFKQGALDEMLNYVKEVTG